MVIRISLFGRPHLCNPAGAWGTGVLLRSCTSGELHQTVMIDPSVGYSLAKFRYSKSRKYRGCTSVKDWVCTTEGCTRIYLGNSRWSQCTRFEPQLNGQSLFIGPIFLEISPCRGWAGTGSTFVVKGSLPTISPGSETTGSNNIQLGLHTSSCHSSVTASPAKMSTNIFRIFNPKGLLKSTRY